MVARPVSLGRDIGENYVCFVMDAGHYPFYFHLHNYLDLYCSYAVLNNYAYKKHEDL